MQYIVIFKAKDKKPNGEDFMSKNYILRVILNRY